MSFVTTAISWLASFAIKTISFFGYFGIFFLMTLESMIVPIPSELVMPFAGFLAAQGTFSMAFVIIASSLGSLIGSLLSYAIGRYGGIVFIRNYGKYLLLDTEDLEKTTKWFRKKGGITIFFSRFIPVVRHLISIPAGMGKMNLRKFCIYTLIGATLWNAFLAYLGYFVGKNWEQVSKYTEPFTFVVLFLLFVVVAWFVYTRIRRIRTKEEKNRNKKKKY